MSLFLRDVFTVAPGALLVSIVCAGGVLLGSGWRPGASAARFAWRRLACGAAVASILLLLLILAPLALAWAGSMRLHDVLVLTLPGAIGAVLVIGVARMLSA